jgi:hypothetical protein
MVVGKPLNANEKDPMMICRCRVQSTENKRRSVPVGKMRLHGRHWLVLLFSGSLAFLCLVGWTAAVGAQAMKRGPSSVRSGQTVCFHLAGCVSLPPETLCLHIPANRKPSMDQWAGTVPLDSESSDTERVPGKFSIIQGLHPSGIACPDDVSRSPMKSFRKLYLQKKALLC